MPEEKLSAKQKAVKDAILQIQDRFGEGAIMKLGAAKAMEVDVIPTGCLSLDLALGAGGVPRGRIVEIYGPEASGKSTLSLTIVASAQRLGGVAAYVDAEHALDPEYARKIGVAVDDLLISQPESGEQALDIVETLVRSNAVDVIVVDSVAALTPRAEIEGEMGEQHMGLHARLMSQALRKLTAIISKSKCIVIFINQIRHKIGVFFGNPETTTGGNALKFYASIRMEARRSTPLKLGEQVIGNRVKVKVVKNKVAPPHGFAEFDILYSEGISIAGDILDTATVRGVIAKSGNSFAFGTTKLGVGRETARMFLKTNPQLLKEIREATMAKARASASDGATAAGTEQRE